MTTSCRTTTTNYFGYVTNGDKGAVGLKFAITNGHVYGGEFSILPADYPADKVGLHFPLTHVRESNGVISFYVTTRYGAEMVEQAYIAKILNKSESVWEVQLMDDPPTRSTPVTFNLMQTD